MKKVRASAARIPQAKRRVSANAFKYKVIPVPAAQNNQERATKASVNADEEAENDDFYCSDVSASKSRKRSHSEIRSSSPAALLPRSSSPVAPLLKKAKFHQRSASQLTPVY